MNTPIIDQRIAKLQSQKNAWLKVKKSERGNIKQLEDVISRLKRWRKELTIKNIVDVHNQVSSTMERISKLNF